MAREAVIRSIQRGYTWLYRNDSKFGSSVLKTKLVGVASLMQTKTNQVSVWYVELYINAPNKCWRFIGERSFPSSVDFHEQNWPNQSHAAQSKILARNMCVQCDSRGFEELGETFWDKYYSCFKELQRPRFKLTRFLHRYLEFPLKG
jgi:hypothetical protein